MAGWEKLVRLTLSPPPSYPPFAFVWPLIRPPRSSVAQPGRLKRPLSDLLLLDHPIPGPGAIYQPLHPGSVSVPRHANLSPPPPTINYVCASQTDGSVHQASRQLESPLSCCGL